MNAQYSLLFVVELANYCWLNMDVAGKEKRPKVRRDLNLGLRL